MDKKAYIKQKPMLKKSYIKYALRGHELTYALYVDWLPSTLSEKYQSALTDVTS